MVVIYKEWLPFYEVGAVLVLDVQHLLVNLLHGHSASEAGCHSQVPGGENGKNIIIGNFDRHFPPYATFIVFS